MKLLLLQQKVNIHTLIQISLNIDYFICSFKKITVKQTTALNK